MVATTGPDSMIWVLIALRSSTLPSGTQRPIGGEWNEEVAPIRAGVGTGYIVIDLIREAEFWDDPITVVP